MEWGKHPILPLMVGGIHGSVGSGLGRQRRLVEKGGGLFIHEISQVQQKCHCRVGRSRCVRTWGSFGILLLGGLGKAVSFFQVWRRSKSTSRSSRGKLDCFGIVTFLSAGGLFGHLEPTSLTRLQFDSRGRCLWTHPDPSCPCVGRQAASCLLNSDSC